MATDNEDLKELNQFKPRPSTLDPNTFKTKRQYTGNQAKPGFCPNLYKKQGRKPLENRNNVEGNFKDRNVTVEESDNLTQTNLNKPNDRKLKNADSNRKTNNGGQVKNQNIRKNHLSYKTNPNQHILQPSCQSTINEGSEFSITCNNSHPKNIWGKNEPRKNYTSKKFNFEKNKLDTLEIIKQLKVASKDENACDFEKVSDMLTNTNISIEYEVLLSFIDIVSKISVKGSAKKLEILKLVFQKQVLDVILTFMQQKTKELTKSDEGIENFNRFFKKFLKLSSLAIKLLPASSLTFLKHALVFTKTILSRLEGRIDITQKHFDFQELVNQIEEKSKMKEHAREDISSSDVENMKNMSVLPTVEDLFGIPPELKKNIVEGAYKNTDHYLTVQFTLLHEDFIAPLREGISEYLSPSSNGVKRKTQVAVYRHVRITHASIHSGKFGHVIQLDSNIKWDILARFFIFGSLLLFTTDLFRSFFTGTVIDINKKDRTIIVKLDTNYFKVCNDIYAKEFVMAVSKVFFEPYYHVLTALQNMSTEEFPMKKFIVEVSSETEPPAYISQLKLDKYTIFGQTSVDILNPIWPQFTEVKFNPSQQKAFQAALTNEFVAIQGPPGTGKTFIGLQIVTALLDNVATNATNSPILIVCYKNHALDQFLEGLLNTTEQIVRIGGRSKNENLKKFNLKDLRGPYGYEKHAGFLESLTVSYFIKKDQMDGLRKHGILSVENVLLYVDSHKLIAELMSISFEDWLMEGVYIGEEYEKDNGEGFVIDKNVNGCSEASKGRVDFECDQSSTLLEKRNQGVNSNNDVKHHNDDSKNINSDEFIQEFEDCPNERNSNEDKFYFSEESKQRYVEMYIDDYSEIYDDAAEEVQEELLNNMHESQGKSLSYSQGLVPCFTLKIQSLKELYEEYERRLQHLAGIEDLDPDEKIYWQSVWKTGMDDVINRISFLKRMLRKKICFQSNEIEKIYVIGEKFGIWSLSNSQRWLLYHSWVNSLAEDINRELIKLEESIRFGEQRLDEARSKANLAVLRGAKIVGVTTTGAASNRSTLNKLGAKIVVIEEAAEVLESHIVTSLSSKCQHLILIGDHKQLRPNPAVYRLCKKYNFDISLFERMIRNGLSCHTLDVQHRMRPEFASLIVPSIYPHLENHPTTENRPDIAGVHSNLYFINHKHPEEKLLETSSHVNKFEAKFVLELANYLLLQGYLAEEITILATYSGQVKEIMKMRDHIMGSKKDLRISTVDDFQGEENKIIILSLVRSNHEGKIGFLKTENRVCVALSRAREGLYIIGNMDCLTETSQIWPLVKERLLEHNALGETLSVYCQNHTETVTLVKNAEMFREMPEGGCSRMCETKMSCDHACKYHCHPRDQQHRDQYKCSMPCERTCKLQHPCRKLCGECGPCKWLVEHDLPCGHKMKAACSSDPTTLMCRVVLPCTLACGHESTRLCCEYEKHVVALKKCERVCDKDKQCGHPCTQACGHMETCDSLYCEVEIEKTLECDHKVMIRCWKRSKPTLCQQKVEKTLNCGHTYLVPCHSSLPLLPVECLVEVEKILTCKHTKLVACGQSVDKVICSKKILRKLSCGHEIWAKCGIPSSSFVCREPCAKLMKCGHLCQEKCSRPCICSTGEEKELSCGHKVRAKCGSKSATCDQPCERDLPCGHKCEDKCGIKCDVRKCKKLAVSNVKPACGHDPVMATCSLNQMRKVDLALNLVVFCKAKCGAKLQCGHICEGDCGSCNTSGFHAPCGQPCGVIFPCGHRCPKKCSDNCGVCNQKCLNKCSHRKCDRICGEPCDVCQEPCDRGCVHSQCRRPCFAICDRRPCPLPCPMPLACGHPCLGFCGERCPPLCMLCTRHPFVDGRNINDRLVILEDCGHIVKAAWMDDFICRNKFRIVKCPAVSCQTPIITTKRYHKELAEAFFNIMKIKRHMEGNESNHVELTVRINQEKNQTNLYGQLSQNGSSRKPNCNTTAYRGKSYQSSQDGATSRNQNFNPTASKGRPHQSSQDGTTSRNQHYNPTAAKGRTYQSNQDGATSRNQNFNPTASKGRPHQSSQDGTTSRNQHYNPTAAKGRLYQSNQDGATSRNQNFNPTASKGRPHQSSQDGTTSRNQHYNPTAAKGRPYQSNQDGATSRNQNFNPTASKGRPYQSSQDGATSRNKHFNPITSRGRPFQSSQNRVTSRNTRNSDPSASRGETRVPFQYKISEE